MPTLDDELRALDALRTIGWRFRSVLDDHGTPVGLVGSRSRRDHTDALFITEAGVSAARVLDDEHGDGGCVWLRQGDDVCAAVDDLLGLPDSDEPGAPRLVRPMPELWTP